MTKLLVADIGTVPYSDALDVQKGVADSRIYGVVPDTLLLLEHPPVYTVGKGGQIDGELRPHEELFSVPPDRITGIDVYPVDRAGNITYHGPGQLVGYPIREVATKRDMVDHIHGLEEMMVRTARDFGIEAYHKDYHPSADGTPIKMRGIVSDVDGVSRKLGAVGVGRSSRNGMTVTMHGFALDVNTDLDPFSWIYACGLSIDHTSLQSLRGDPIPLEEVKAEALKHFADVFGYNDIQHELRVSSV